MSSEIEKSVKYLGTVCGTYNPFPICEKKNISINYIDVERPLGDTVYDNDEPVILLANSIRESSQRYFVCAHELGHVMLHTGIQGYYIVNNRTRGKMEVEADHFAFALCQKLFEEDFGYPAESKNQLKRTYGVV
ncbi:MAG: ImmA/IrrE family metallo-endopeptidase [Liquorilactobacillus nagelii]|uniref:ImmA/IrrE family metallo-endopeptidase n=1 Tax=Lactobacillaceae TaxID=33958 RepID=UPI0039E9B738